MSVTLMMLAACGVLLVVPATAAERLRGPAALVFLVAFGLASIAAAQEMPVLVVSDAALSAEGPEGQRLTFNVENTTGRTITAWGVKLTYGTDDGATTVTHFAVDGYLRFEGVPQDADGRESFYVIAPHQRVVAWGRRALPPEPRVVRVAAEFEWAVFDDCTAIGNEGDLAILFEKRAVEARGWGRVAAELRSVSQLESRRDALTQAASRLSSRQEHADVAEQITRMVALNIEKGLAGHLPAWASGDGVERLYHHWKYEAEQKAAAAEKHRVRKR